MGVNIQTLKDIRFYLADELVKIYPEKEIIALSNIIIETVFGITKLHQLYQRDQIITREQSLKIIDICKELKTGKPVQYILGDAFFYDCKIRVTEATLIPRPETEEMVDLIIKENRDYKGSILDLGTGSGCIAIALAAHMPGIEITGIDISEEALMIAKDNSLLNNVTVTFLKNDILNFNFTTTGGTGIIVSNPPYVRNSEKQFMNKNVLEYEPSLALFVSDADPLLYFRAILIIAEKILLPSGKLYFEINEALGKSMITLLESFRYSDIQIVPDLNGKDRIIKGRKHA